jgi:hypothetical protein
MHGVLLQREWAEDCKIASEHGTDMPTECRSAVELSRENSERRRSERNYGTEQRGDALICVRIEERTFYPRRRLTVDKQYSVQLQLKMLLSGCLCRSRDLGDVLMLVPHLREQCTRSCVLMRIVSGELVAESPQGY